MSFQYPIAALEEPMRSRLISSHRKSLITVLAVAASAICWSAAGMIVLRIKGQAAPDPQWRTSCYVLIAFLALASIAVSRSQLRSLRLTSIAESLGPDALVTHLVRTTLISACLFTNSSGAGLHGVSYNIYVFGPAEPRAFLAIPVQGFGKRRPGVQ